MNNNIIISDGWSKFCTNLLSICPALPCRQCLIIRMNVNVQVNLIINATRLHYFVNFCTMGGLVGAHLMLLNMALVVGQV